MPITGRNVRPQSFFNRETGLNGDFGRGTPTKGIQDGAIVVSWNLLGESFLQETSVETLDIEKLPPRLLHYDISKRYHHKVVISYLVVLKLMCIICIV